MNRFRKALQRVAAAMVLGVASLGAASSADASMLFNVYFDNVFDEVVTAQDVIGSGTFGFDNDLLDGSYLYTGLVNPQIVFTVMGETFTQADMSTSPAMEVVIYTTPRGRDFYFSAPLGSGAYFGGSVEFQNANGAILSLEPAGFSPIPYNLYFGSGGTLDASGTYGSVVVPEPGTFSMMSTLFTLVIGWTRGRRD